MEYVAENCEEDDKIPQVQASCETARHRQYSWGPTVLSDSLQHCLWPLRPVITLEGIWHEDILLSAVISVQYDSVVAHYLLASLVVSSTDINKGNGKCVNTV